MDIQFNSSLKAFIIDNGILTTMAAVTIAFSTGTFIRSFVSEIVLPALYSLVLSRVKFMPKGGAFKPLSSLNYDNFFKELLSWIFVIIFTFVTIQYVVRAYVYSGGGGKGGGGGGGANPGNPGNPANLNTNYTI